VTVVALVAIKTELEDPYNVLDNWDINSVDPCSWRMVTCDADGFVSSLSVSVSHLFCCKFIIVGMNEVLAIEC
jgi:Leucine rich repeat N-terminal domain